MSRPRQTQKLRSAALRLHVGREHRFELLADVAGLTPAFREIVEVARDLTFVPGEQDRFDA